MTLIESIYKEPEKWKVTEHLLMHENGAQLWISNGASYCRPYPGGHFSFWERRRAWKAYKWWCKTAPVEAYGIRPMALPYNGK